MIILLLIVKDWHQYSDYGIDNYLIELIIDNINYYIISYHFNYTLVFTKSI